MHPYHLKHFGILVLLCLLLACNSIPEKAKPVRSFDKTKYLGVWYEIARIDFKYERDLSNVTASYSLRSDGKIRVDNKGYDEKDHKWERSIGKAKFVGDESVAKLKVSFFGPFYSGYNVIAIDKDYEYALVAGKSLDYLWILSRKPTIPDGIKTFYLSIARNIGYDISRLTWPVHDRDQYVR